MATPHKCPVCGKYEFPDRDSFDICKVCNWQDDSLQDEDHDYWGGANDMSVNQAREAYQRGEQVY
jgi:hypothetical protein